MRIHSLTAAFLFVVANASAATHPPFEARVVGVSDGDTITVLNTDQVPQKIRLSGIDAPEKGQAFSDRSKQNLSRLVHDRKVRIEWSKVDQYARLVAKVLVLPSAPCARSPCPPAMDANLAQLAAGFAWHYRHYENEQPKQDRQSYSAAEQRAREEKVGLWKDANPIPPWDWRKLKPRKPQGS